MNTELNYYEIELGYLKDGANEIDYEAPFTICVSTPYFPDNECVLELCNVELEKDYDYVHSITRISEEEKDEYFEDETYRVMPKMERKDMVKVVHQIMRSATSDYASYILESEDEKTNITFIDAVIDDIICTSAWKDGDYFSDDDVRLSIGREFMYRLGIVV